MNDKAVKKLRKRIFKDKKDMQVSKEYFKKVGKTMMYIGLMREYKDAKKKHKRDKSYGGTI